MIPEQRLLLDIIRQAIRDYIKLDPDSDTVSAEYYIDEGADYLTAEEFLFNNSSIPYGKWSLTFRDACQILDLDNRKIKKKIARNIIEY